jgi:nucleoside-triphosphatase THEP1
MACSVADKFDSIYFNFLMKIDDRDFVERVEDVLRVEEHFVSVVHLQTVTEHVLVDGFRRDRSCRWAL